jgi:hypothetical protein
LLLTPAVENAGLTADNVKHQQGCLLLEFNAGETVKRFRSSWWRAFRGTVEHGAWASVRQMIDGKYAIVTGLLGLDLVHAPWTEIHPVWALAIGDVPVAVEI